MHTKEVLKAWAAILNGRAPSMSIEITKECPLRCPGCYAYEDEHLTGGITLRQLVDHKGDDLVRGVLNLVDRERPLHLSIVGGDPLVRLRELEVLLPQLVERGIYIQVVTSAFRAVPKSWASLPGFNLAVSIDGLQPEHDERRKPATYARILKNIEGQQVIVHCTITGQMMKRDGYLEEFFRFWATRPEIKKIWTSFFTPQRGAEAPECLSVEERDRAIEELLRLRRIFPKFDVGPGTLREFAKPPASPKDCIFARTTLTLSADLKTKITPCQFGGDPDCTRCGCMASMGLAAVGSTKLGGILPVRHIFMASARIGEMMAHRRDRDERQIPPATVPSPFVVR
jgi:MoaA/NifB/PqqE/SkfB family radical SAM enzyme